MAEADLVLEIRKRLAKGEPEEQIRASLGKAGDSAEDINGAFAKVKLENSPLHKIPTSSWSSTPARKVKSSLLFNVLIIVLFLSAAPAAYGLLGPVVQNVIAQISGTQTATTTRATNQNLFGIVPLIPEGTGLPLPAPKSTAQSSHPISNGRSEGPVQTIASIFGVSTPAPSQTTTVVTTTDTPTNPVVVSTPDTTTPVVVTSPPVVDDPPPVIVTPPPDPTPVPDPVVTTPPPDQSTSTASTSSSTPVVVTPPPPDPNAANVNIPAAPSGTYPVFASCDAAPTSFAHTVYIDPVGGSDTTGDGSQAHPYQYLASAIFNKIPSNTHVVILPGHQVGMEVTSYSAAKLATGTGWIWLDFQPGAVIDNMQIRDMHDWLITNPEMTYPAEGKLLMSFQGGNNMIFADANMYTVKDSSSWTVAQWVVADGAIGVDNTTCVSLLRNQMTNVHTGIQMVSRGTSPNPSDNSLKVLVEYNTLRNFSGDGMNPYGSDITIAHNAMYDEYAGPADGDANHDDAIQGAALNGAVFNNLTIDHNWIQQSTDPNRKWNTYLQGIDSFDGVYRNVRVTNNVVMSSAGHGISLYGVTDSVIDHNTVIDPYPGGMAAWIYIAVGKGGTDIPSNDTISNNTTLTLVATTTGVTYINNSILGANLSDSFTTIDLAHNIFDMTPKPGSALAKSGAGVPPDMYHPPAVVAINDSQKSTALAIAPKKSNPGSVLVASVQTAAQKSSSWFVNFWHSIWSAILAFFHSI